MGIMESNMEMRENKYIVVDGKENQTVDNKPKGFRKYLSTRNLLIATFLMTIGGLVYVLWITTRYYRLCHRSESMNSTLCLGKPLPSMTPLRRNMTDESTYE